MTAKSRWLTKICPDSPEFPKNTQIDICWSNSESDEETPTKKVKNIKNKWFTADSKPSLKVNKKNVFPTVTNDLYENSSNHCQPVDIDIWKFNSTQGATQILDSSCNETNNTGILHGCCESPISNTVKLEELSPVLVCTQDDFIANEATSPVLINKKSVLKRIRFRYKTKRIINRIEESSPELFEKESTQIIESDSPEHKDTSLPTECIEPFPSQDSSQVINSNDEPHKSITLYHQPAPRKKRYKKGGLASLLQKTLHLQRTRASIWNHEMYTKKTENIIIFEQGKVIEFVVKNKWKEYGNTLLECNLLPFQHVSELPIENNFIVIIGFSANINFTLNTNSHYKLFPPYSIKTVKYNSEEVPCYFNVSKLVPSK